jgi:transposase InsO family protein
MHAPVLSAGPPANPSSCPEDARGYSGPRNLDSGSGSLFVIGRSHVAVLDWFSRYVVSWEPDQTLALPFVLSAVVRALVQATPVIWNGNQGSHFTSPQYLELLTAAGVQIGMGGQG